MRIYAYLYEYVSQESADETSPVKRERRLLFWSRQLTFGGFEPLGIDHYIVVEAAISAANVSYETVLVEHTAPFEQVFFKLYTILVMIFIKYTYKYVSNGYINILIQGNLRFYILRVSCSLYCTN